MIKLVLIGLVSLYLTGCSAPSVQIKETRLPEGLLEKCLGMPSAIPPKTGEDLVQGFIVAREGHATCSAVVQAVKMYYTKD